MRAARYALGVLGYLRRMVETWSARPYIANWLRDANLRSKCICRRIGRSFRIHPRISD
jgi:hypothetical protein